MPYQHQVARAGRIVMASATAGVLFATVAACGSDDQPSTQKSASATPSSSPTSQTATPTPSASPTPTTPPLSRFEDEPMVQAARAWAVAYSTDINNRDQNHTEFKKQSTAKAIARGDFYEGQDLKDGGYEPGPVPFTPLRIVGGSTPRVEACMQFDGWALNRKTKQPIDPKRSVDGVRIYMRRVAGVWKFDRLQSDNSVQCGSVVVKGVPWPA